ncbi:restriction system-associated AAA family ATPase [uncultured Algoriphagus sp.]|uniref:restriction system-associated AAA family ATPase n=1 Tax=uncultured Algoriphagus sp. TaxID=417365 RepID=UPI00259868C8|nr:restriction system-associated AAA family ATPase [uncultured Algoriphagus sp.]
MKLLRLQIAQDFRSLKAGFELRFRDAAHLDSMQAFRPFCFAGLNGSGKSNVLEALANIFYHLDLCASRFKPRAFEKFFNPANNINGPNAFELEYLTFPKTGRGLADGYNRIRVIKEDKGVPKMFQTFYPFNTLEEQKEPTETEIDLVADKDQKQAAEGKNYLPELVVGYSSGENEILSIPFIKSRLIHLDEYAESSARYLSEGLQFEQSESSLTYIDSEMSQAVLLASLIFEDKKTTLKPLLRELRIKRLRSFRMHLNNRVLTVAKENKEIVHPLALDHLSEKINLLRQLATSWFEEKTEGRGFGKDAEACETSILILDFFVDDEMKEAFKGVFSSSLEMFQFFQLLYELNNTFLETANIDSGIKEEVYKSEGFYTDGKLPVPGPAEKVFFFLNFYLEKYKYGSTTETDELLLRNFSDGEHQFIHTMGICLLIKNMRTIMLLDEPETHFNPDWRSQFISILDESITAGGSNNLMTDVLLTSHSPFIISDCLPDNVIFFSRNRESRYVEAKTAKEMGFNTYGASVNYILKNFFNTEFLGSKSLNEMKRLIKEGSLDELTAATERFSESGKKQFLYKRIFELTNADESTED